MLDKAIAVALLILFYAISCQRWTDIWLSLLKMLEYRSFYEETLLHFQTHNCINNAMYCIKFKLKQM